MCAVQSGRRDFTQQLECRRALFGRKRADHEPRSLMREGLRQRGMPMAEARDRDPGEEIDVGVAVGVGEGRAFAVIECDAGEQRNPLASGRDVALLSVEDFFRLGTGDWSLD
jgi:hypothetical protein